MKYPRECSMYTWEEYIVFWFLVEYFIDVLGSLVSSAIQVFYFLVEAFTSLLSIIKSVIMRFLTIIEVLNLSKHLAIAMPVGCAVEMLSEPQCPPVYEHTFTFMWSAYTFLDLNHKWNKLITCRKFC